VKPEIFDDLWTEFVQNTDWNESRIFGAFWNTDTEKQMLAQNRTLKQVRVYESMRPREWLREFGTCADNIKEGVSTIRQAGRGAFATRALPKGARVAAMPLIQITDKSQLEMYLLEDIKPKKREERRMAGYQLIMNYCYSQKETTMLLCPYGPLVNLVNHNKTQANVRLQWSDPKRGNHEADMLTKDISAFAADRTSKLSMDLVATRDIKPGDEVFLDYGDSW